MTKESCRTCKFYKYYNFNDSCDRYPPVIDQTQMAFRGSDCLNSTLRVATYPDNWCGEYKLEAIGENND